CNPGKIIPLPRGCGEGRAVATVEVSEPRAVATGSPQADEISGRSTNLSLSDLPRDRSAQKQALISTKLNEARTAREFSLIVGDQSVRRLTDAIETSQKISGRPLEVAPQSSQAAAQVM